MEELVFELGGHQNTVRTILIDGHNILLFFPQTVTIFSKTFMRLFSCVMNVHFSKKNEYSPFDVEEWYQKKTGMGFSDNYSAVGFGFNDIRKFHQQVGIDKFNRVELQLLKFLDQNRFIITDDKIKKILRSRYFYIIAINPESCIYQNVIFRHEMSHALYGFNDGYRKLIDDIWEGLDEKMRRQMVGRFYPVPEERHAAEYGARVIESKEIFVSLKDRKKIQSAFDRIVPEKDLL